MDPILNPIILYAGLALGAIGVAIAMPRRGTNPQIIGALIAGAGIGAVMIALAVIGFRSGEGIANIFFYVFALIGLGSALRVITHQRPVYAALYFVLTILSSAGLFLLLAAEFMTFALVIIYAGAILITYLFVIMLATQAPTEEAVEALSEYDAQSREPIVSTVVGFALLAALVGMMGYGVPQLPPPTDVNPRIALERMPGKVQTFLEDVGIADDVMPARLLAEQTVGRNATDEERQAARDANTQWRQQYSGYKIQQFAGHEHAGSIRLTLKDPEGFQRRIDAARDIDAGLELTDQLAAAKPLSPEAYALLVSGVVLADREGELYSTSMWIPMSALPENLETVGLALVGEHPLSLELAGVILLLAMVGAVILARKQTEVEEERKAEQATQLKLGAEGGAA